MVYYNSEKPKSGLSAQEQLIGELEVSQELSKEEMTYLATLPGKCAHQSSAENRIARKHFAKSQLQIPLFSMNLGTVTAYELPQGGSGVLPQCQAIL